VQLSAARRERSGLRDGLEYLELTKIHGEGRGLFEKPLPVAR
jgi:hypothetical protein